MSAPGCSLRHVLFVSVLSLSSAIRPTPARADAPVRGDAQPPALDRAIEAYEAGRMLEARRWFIVAHEREPNARTLRGLGVVSYALGDFEEAAMYLEAALHHPTRPLTEELRVLVVQLRDEARTHLGRVQLEPVRVGATLWIDGIAASLDEQGGVYVSPGSHAVHVNAPGYTAENTDVLIEAGSVVRVDVGPAAAEPVEPGEDDPVVGPDDPIEPPSPPLAPRPLRRGALIGTSVAGAGALLAGGTLLLIANARVNSLCDGACLDPDHRAARYDEENIRGLVTTGAVMITVGGLAEIASGLVYLVRRGGTDEPSNTVIVGARSLSWQRRF